MEQAEAARLVNATFESSGAFLVRYAFRRTKSPPLAEDIVQETFLSLYRHLRTGKQIHDPKSWALGAVRNQVCKHARDRARHGEQLVPTDQLDLIPGHPLQEEQQEEASIPALLSVLTPREEEVISLRLQSLKYREIADALGISSKSVSTLLTRAIRKLQQSVSRSAAASPPHPITTERGVPHAL